MVSSIHWESMQEEAVPPDNRELRHAMQIQELMFANALQIQELMVAAASKDP